jgi:hypothetical protein
MLVLLVLLVVGLVVMGWYALVVVARIERPVGTILILSSMLVLMLMLMLGVEIEIVKPDPAVVGVRTLVCRC